jgi:hypothetical protein
MRGVRSSIRSNCRHRAHLFVGPGESGGIEAVKYPEEVDLEMSMNPSCIKRPSSPLVAHGSKEQPSSPIAADPCYNTAVAQESSDVILW